MVSQFFFPCLEVDSGTMFRDQSKDKDDTDEECGRSKVKRKGKRASSSAFNHESNDDDEDFEQYLEGMFP
ncbi:hypothetical protein CRYUN_Cryun01aG0259300 [Craigia yunnanensis]